MRGHPLIILLLALFSLSGCHSVNKPDNYKGLSPQAIYTQAKDHLAKERFHLAIQDLEAFEARYPYDNNAGNAQLDLIYAYYKQGDTALALSTANLFIRMHPDHPKADYAYYLKGLVNFDQNFGFKFRYLPLDRSTRDPTEAKEAFNSFKLLLLRFPQSTYANDARQRMRHLREQLAYHELAVAEYYLKKGAYLSAANRANYLINHFSQTSAVQPALSLLAQAYQKLGMDPLAKDALKALKHN